MDVASLLSTVQPWLKPNNPIPNPEMSNQLSTAPNRTDANEPTAEDVIAETLSVNTEKSLATPGTTTTQEPVEDCPSGLHGMFVKQSVKCKRSATGTNPFGVQPFADLENTESSAERAVRMQKDIQRLMHFVTVVGHVDSFLTSRFRSGLKKMAKLYESEEVNQPKRPRRRIAF